MAHTKIISAAGWDWGHAPCTPVKISSRGLIGHDRREFLKTASHVFADYLDHCKVAEDEEPVHALAVGAFERWGLNRNGDGFSEEACRRYHPTFEKFARAYRSHQNRDPAKSYGVIKKAAYNEDMKRIELLVAYNKTKAAAERNGGLVADKELEKLARDESLSGSMACRVSHDVCTFCGNQARTRDDYCTAAMCKAGGCKDNLTRLVKIGNDVHQLGVMNPHPTWFDWSLVLRPAERTAYGGRADWLTKAAGDDFDGFFGVSSSKLAEDLEVMAPLAVILDQEGTLPFSHQTALDEQVKLAYGLDLLDRRPQLWPPPGCHSAFTREVQGEPDLSPLGEPGTVKCAEALTALAEQTVVLPLRDFARLTKRAELAETARPRLRGVYGRMLADGSLERRLTANPCALLTKAASTPLRRWAAGQYSSLSLDHDAVARRCQLAAVRGQAAPDIDFENHAKTAGESGPAEELARDYACYRAAALRQIAGQEGNFTLTVRLATAQNQVR